MSGGTRAVAHTSRFARSVCHLLSEEEACVFASCGIAWFYGGTDLVSTWTCSRSSCVLSCARSPTNIRENAIANSLATAYTTAARRLEWLRTPFGPSWVTGIQWFRQNRTRTFDESSVIGQIAPTHRIRGFSFSLVLLCARAMYRSSRSRSPRCVCRVSIVTREKERERERMRDRERSFLRIYVASSNPPKYRTGSRGSSSHLVFLFFFFSAVYRSECISGKLWLPV